MQVHDVGRLSLGQWAAQVQGWNKAHGKSKPKTPSDDEFDAAVAAALL